MPSSTSQHFPGRSGDTVQITHWNPIGSAMQLLTSYESLVFIKGSIKKVNMFLEETLILPNIFKNKFQL